MQHILCPLLHLPLVISTLSTTVLSANHAVTFTGAQFFLLRIRRGDIPFKNTITMSYTVLFFMICLVYSLCHQAFHPPCHLVYPVIHGTINCANKYANQCTISSAICESQHGSLLLHMLTFLQNAKFLLALDLEIY